MFKQINNLAGDEVYLLISLVIFITFFVIATFALFKMKKPYLDYMSDIPLEEERTNKSIE